MRPTCCTLWIGQTLGPVERACLLSVVRQGHPFHLYCYEEPEGVPAGIQLCDAESIIPRTRIIRHRTGSVSLFSNWFRYELQRLGRGTWLDCDVYLLAPLQYDNPYLFGRAPCLPGDIRSNLIYSGVLRLPTDSPLLPRLLALFEEREVPAWLSWRARLGAYLRLWRTGATGLSRMPWGSAGPFAVTALAEEYGVARFALSADIFYPVHWPDADWVLDPSRRLEDMVTPQTVALHLWNECIKGFKDEPAPQGSFLARLQEEGRCGDRNELADGARHGC